jgi:hypothetical protein
MKLARIFNLTFRSTSSQLKREAASHSLPCENNCLRHKEDPLNKLYNGICLKDKEKDRASLVDLVVRPKVPQLAPNRTRARIKSRAGMLGLA